jgi:hypothetical protein
MSQFRDLPLSPAEMVQLNQQLQGLHLANDGRGSVQSGPDRTLQLIQQLGYLQIDSIYVVQRAHHHILHSRLSDYQPDWLAQLQACGQIFEYWSHAAAYLPMADYRYSLFRKAQLQQGKKHWFDANHQQMQLVRRRIAQEGPLKSSDFVKTEQKKGSWWDWQPAKQALEQLFMQGELMVCRRDKFEKVFDLTERVLPVGVDQRLPDLTEMVGYLINRALDSHGFATAAQISYLRQGLKKPVLQQLLERQAGGELARFGLQGQQYFYRQQLPALVRAPAKVWLLNPFDNLLIQRQRVQHWYAADFQLEVYLPAAKRQVGYYNLAIVYRDQWVGQVDVKADRQQQVLLLQHLVLTKQPPQRAAFGRALVRALADYAAFNGCKRWQLVKAEPDVRHWLLSLVSKDEKHNEDKL